VSVDIVRDKAVNTLLRVFEHGAYLNIALDASLRRKKVSERGRRFLTQLVYGTVRHRLLCDHVLERCLDRPAEKLPAPVVTILRMGVFQALFCEQVTFPAMVHTSVDLAKKWEHAGLARLTNAVLRRVPHSLADVRLPPRDQDLPRHLSVRHSMPQWLVEHWLAAYGEATAEALCEASNTEAPTTLRVNTLRTSVEELTDGLTKGGWALEKRTAIPEELTLTGGPPPARSKLFLHGHFMLQDPASMLPPHLLEPRPGETVLDMCAAPGAKTTQLAQLAEDRAQVVAMDVHLRKLGLVGQNADRLGISCVQVVNGDGQRAPFPCECFDRVLVDAPCTGWGTLRRHPDLKWRTSLDQPERLSLLQRALLRAAVQRCKSGGLIVYAVCTFSRQETCDVVRAIVDETTVAPEDGPAWLNQWKTDQGQYQTLPTKEGLDGFFLTRLRKAS